MLKINRKVLESSATLVSCTIGAGILGIPYVIEKSGFLLGVIELIMIGLIFFIIDSMLSEMSLKERSNSQLANYAEKYLGRKGKILTTLTLTFAITGAMTAYLIATGNFLSQIFFRTSAYHVEFALLFFVIMTILIYLGLDIVERSELYMMFLFIVVIVMLFAMAAPKINVVNFESIHLHNLFVPLGVLLFAFTNLPAIPEAREEIRGEEKYFKRVILIGILVPLLLYLIFTITILGISGSKTSPSAILNLSGLGSSALTLGLLFGTLTMSTTFLALGLALRDMYRYDFKQGKIKSTFLALAPPLILFLLGIRNFTTVLSITGSISGFLLSLIVILMYTNYAEKNKVHSWLNSRLLKLGITLFLLVGVGYQLFHII